MADYTIPGSRYRDGMLLVHNILDRAVDELKQFKMIDGDVLVAGYPKTGSTWLEELTWLVFNGGDIAGAREKPIHHRVRYLEMSVDGRTPELEVVLTSPRPCVMKTHLKADVFKNQIDAGSVKVIVGIRNPKDTWVSLYHFYRMHRGFGNYPGTWSEFFDLCIKDKVIYGNFFNWYESWFKYLHRPNVILVKYEDMKRKLSEVLTEVSTFLGKPLPDDVRPKIIEHLSFESMKNNSATNQTTVPVYDQSISPFIRKGVVGDWKNYFNEEQSSFVDIMYKKMIESQGIILEFE